MLRSKCWSDNLSAKITVLFLTYWNMALRISENVFIHLWIFITFDRLDEVKQDSQHNIFKAVDHIFIELLGSDVRTIGYPLRLELVQQMVHPKVNR